MSCLHTKTLMSSFIDHELNDSDYRQVQSHLDSCPECATIYTEMKDNADLLRHLPVVKAPEKLAHSIATLIDQGNGSLTVNKSAQAFRLRTWILSSAAMFLIMVNVIFIFQDTDPERSIEIIAESQESSPASQKQNNKRKRGVDNEHKLSIGKNRNESPPRKNEFKKSPSEIENSIKDENKDSSYPEERTSSRTQDQIYSKTEGDIPTTDSMVPESRKPFAQAPTILEHSEEMEDLIPATPESPPGSTASLRQDQETFGIGAEESTGKTHTVWSITAQDPNHMADQLFKMAHAGSTNTFTSKSHAKGDDKSSTHQDAEKRAKEKTEHLQKRNSTFITLACTPDQASNILQLLKSMQATSAEEASAYDGNRSQQNDSKTQAGKTLENVTPLQESSGSLAKKKKIKETNLVYINILIHPQNK